MIRTDYEYGWDDLSYSEFALKMTEGWRSDETPCGRGSEIRFARQAADVLVSVVEEHGIETIANVGAGDLNWLSIIPWQLRVPQMRHFDILPRRECVELLDIVYQTLPRSFDLIFCRHVLNHVSCRMAFDALRNFVDSGSSWLLMTSCNNQDRYWEHWLKLPDPVATYPDTGTWRLQLYDLRCHDPFVERREA